MLVCYALCADLLAAKEAIRIFTKQSVSFMVFWPFLHIYIHICMYIHTHTQPYVTYLLWTFLCFRAVKKTR